MSFSNAYNKVGENYAANSSQGSMGPTPSVGRFRNIGEVPSLFIKGTSCPGHDVVSYSMAPKSSPGMLKGHLQAEQKPMNHNTGSHAGSNPGQEGKMNSLTPKKSS